jgi:flagellar basal-body rod protein FlgG
MIDAVRACLKEELRMDVITNNLSNAATIGYKKHRIAFQDALNGAQGGDTSAPPDPALVRTEVDFSPGDVRSTGNPLDLVINGRGFFKVQSPEGVRYTRKGNFTLDGQGFLITQQNQYVLGQGGPIQIPAGTISVDSLGAIHVNGQEQGRLDLVDFEKSEVLEMTGHALFANPSGEPEIGLDYQSGVEQGYTEQSNVEVAEEMVNMIHSLRAFESYQKVIQVLDELNNRVINEVSQLR